ncbi:MAG: glycosyltransferase, partial [Terriglobia bacterium]
MVLHPHPFVSAIVPARNEEANIARSVRSIAAQPEILEIIVVDDQSEDRTPEILKELEAPTLRILRVDHLPSGWLGKPHALVAGARIASGDWLLFTDADTEHRPGSLRTLVARAEESGLSMLSISPG